MALDHEHWMQQALDEARNAGSLNEVPVGAVIVGPDGKKLAAAGNRTISNNDPTAHAEIIALREAASLIGNYRLVDCTVYSTIEPCVMCAGALINARIARLVFGAHDLRFGAVETHFNLCSTSILNHQIEIVSGICAEQCRELIQTFFRARR